MRSAPCKWQLDASFKSQQPRPEHLIILIVFLIEVPLPLRNLTHHRSMQLSSYHTTDGHPMLAELKELSTRLLSVTQPGNSSHYSMKNIFSSSVLASNISCTIKMCHEKLEKQSEQKSCSRLFLPFSVHSFVRSMDVCKQIIYHRPRAALAS
jgi:hypothetical protein